MLTVPTELRASPIHGIGCFLLAPVKKNDLVWRFDARIDRAYSQFEIESLPEMVRTLVKTYGIFHEASGLWMLCGDNARHFNHADAPTTLSLGIGFADDIAARDLAAGEELTSDYKTICDVTKATGKL
ncbi:MAG TPA: SET domain-containing protein [Alphaproteobacteria bacterium]|nr:SET domain-containing protein [Alphaproteobacteria bacterium]